MTNTAVPQWHDTTYNGWANYATWRVNLELVDDYASSLAEDVESGHLDRWESVRDLADTFQQFVEDVLTGELGGPTEGLVVDYALSFVQDVDWREIAEHWTDELLQAYEGGFEAGVSDEVVGTLRHQLGDECPEL